MLSYEANPPRLRMAVSYLLAGMVGALCVVNVAAQAGPTVDNNKGLPNNKIEGRLFFPSGSAVTPVRITLSGDRGDQSTNNDRDGRFFFRGLRPGRYTLVVDGGDTFQSVSQMVDVMPVGMPGVQGDNFSETPTINIRLQFKSSESAAGVINAELANVPKEAVDLYNSALKSANQGDRKKATELLKKAISIHPQFLAALNGLGVQYMKLGELDSAADTFGSALKVKPDSSLLHLNYGLVLFQQKKYAEADQQLDLALSKTEGSATAHFYKGRTLIALHRYADAEVHLQRVVALGGEEATLAHRYLGGLYVEKGDNARAITELETFLKLEPKTKEADKIRELIKQLQSTLRPK